MTSKKSRRWRNIRKDCFSKGEGRCLYCKRQVDNSSFTIDHIVPQCSISCPPGRDNLVIACASCNSRKGCRNFIDFISEDSLVNRTYRTLDSKSKLISLYMKAIGFKSFDNLLG